MARLHFEETQAFRQNRWFWILVIVSSLVTLLPLADGIYWQLFRGEPWGNEPLSDGGLLGLFAFVLFTWGIAMVVAISVRLDVRIDDQAIYYRFVPIKPKWQSVLKEEISHYSIEKKFRFLQSGGFGYHRNRLTRTWSMRIRGSHHLSLVLKDGRKILLGTQNPEGLERAMKRLANPTEMI
jgi:hypothetical protein